MSWRWVPDPPSAGRPGAPVGLPDRTFPSQGEAERWLAEFYPELAESGVRAVSLYEADRLVYGPMSLDPEP